MPDIPVERIICTPDRDQGDITTLANSIDQVGLLQPILLRPVGDKFEVVDGRRRFAAMMQLGWTVIPERAFAIAPEKAEKFGPFSLCFCRDML